MNHIDYKYANMLSSKLERFTIKSTQPFKANCRCPLCGDSKTDKSKTRGWILEQSNVFTSYYCHNCNANLPFAGFLQKVDINLYNDYIKESLLEKYKGNESKVVKPTRIREMDFKTPRFLKNKSPLLRIKKISQLKPDHPARLYVDDRKIPIKAHYKIYYASKFVNWVNSIIPEKLGNMPEHPRLVLPFINRSNELVGFSGRSFDPREKQRKYISIMLDKSASKVYNLNEIDFNKRYYIVEGPIDSLFLDNAMAMAGADIDISILTNTKNCVIIFDNEPRNSDIVRNIDKAIDQKLSVVVWPDYLQEKDINDMVLSGRSPNEIKLLIDSCTYKGLSAKVELTKWRKC